MTEGEFDWHTAGLMVPCPRCSAVRGEECITRSGRPYHWLHASRTEVVSYSWRGGWNQRTTDLVRWFTSDPLDFRRFVARWIAQNWGPRA